MSRPPAKPYEVFLKNRLKNPREAAAYLQAALEEGDEKVFLLALRDVAGAHGLTRLASRSRLNRENLYQMLSRSGNPRFSSLARILKALGLRLAIQTRSAG